MVLARSKTSKGPVTFRSRTSSKATKTTLRVPTPGTVGCPPGTKWLQNGVEDAVHIVNLQSSEKSIGRPLVRAETCKRHYQGKTRVGTASYANAPPSAATRYGRAHSARRPAYTARDAVGTGLALRAPLAG